MRATSRMTEDEAVEVVVRVPLRQLALMTEDEAVERLASLARFHISAVKAFVDKGSTT